MAIIVHVVSDSGIDWPAVAAAGATAVAAVGGIWGTARQARHGREAATEDLKKSLAVAQENLQLTIAAENERVHATEKNRSHDATEQRITELYSKAVEQLGHEKAPVRLGGFYALERLAQDNTEHRQTVVDVVCAYLRMPFNPDPHAGDASAESETSQELQVRLAAQSLLIRHLEVPMMPSREKGIAFAQPSKPPRSYWKKLKLDLTGSLLIDLDFTLCVLDDVNFTRARFEGETKFWNTRFAGLSIFDSAKFRGIAGFGRALFSGEAYFKNTDFSREADFERAVFGMHGVLKKQNSEVMLFSIEQSLTWVRFLMKRGLMELLSFVEPSSAVQTDSIQRSSRTVSRISPILPLVSQIVISAGRLHGK